MRVYPKIVVWMLSGWWLSHPSEKYESQMGLLFPIYGKNVPNHQPVVVIWNMMINNHVWMIH
jgi:hypothetical protein